MELINQFKKKILENGSLSNKITIKNYLSDLRKFVAWYELKYNHSFFPSTITSQLVDDYINLIAQHSPRSAKRYRSSLRKFFTFLVAEGLTTHNPLIAKPDQEINPDPWHLKSFNNFLYTQGSSPLTMKNYAHDVSQFLIWLREVTAGHLFEPDHSASSSWPRGPQSRKPERFVGSQPSTQYDVFANINTFALEEYKNRLLNQAQLSPLSVNRKLSSLRKYIGWIESKGLLKRNAEVASSIQMVKEESGEEKPSTSQVFGLHSESQLNQPIASAEAPNDQTENEENTKKQYSGFPPLRLLQKTKTGINLAYDALVVLSILKFVEAIKYNLFKDSAQQVFATLPIASEAIEQAGSQFAGIPQKYKPSKVTLNKPSVIDHFVTTSNVTTQKTISTMSGIKSVSKEIYAPLKISTTAMPIWKRTMFHLKYNRPKWYKKYHSYPVVHYLHFALVLVFTTFAAFSLFHAFERPAATPTAVLASKISSNRLITFHGRLQDTTDTPITKESLLRFAVYKNQTSPSTEAVWQEKQSITPDENGNFSTTLGKIAPMSQEIFNDNPSLYLGISIGTDSELLPRTPLASIGLTQDSEQLQGLKPITGNNAGTSNVILALDSSGNLTIGGSANPVFQATGGEFKLSGSQLTLATNLDSNSNIVLNPDGTGIIDLQKPLQNTSENNNLLPALGAVEVDDNFAILASSSAQSALYINQNGTGELISASSNGTAKFTIDNAGSGTFAGDVNINGNNLNTVTGTFNIANKNTLTLNIGGDATSVNIASSSGATIINNNLKVGGQLSISGFESGAIPFVNGDRQVAQDRDNFFWDQSNKRLGIGTSTPGSKLSVVGMSQGTGTALVIDAAGNIFQSSSSRRYKDDIRDLTTDFDKVLEISPVVFRYKNTGSVDIGYIAEDFDSLGLKDLVLYNQQGQPDAIKYDKLSIYLLEIVKKQQKTLNILKEGAENAKVLEKTVKSVQEFVDTLHAGLLEVGKISADSISVTTDNITIGTQTLREYITGIVNEIVDKRLTEENKKTVVVINPLADNYEVANEPNETQETNVPNETSVSFVPSVSSSSSANITNITNIYNNASPSATITPNPTPIASDSATLSPTPTPTEVANEPNETQETNVPNETSVSFVPSVSFSTYHTDFAQFDYGLIAGGPTSLADTAINGQLSIGQNLTLTDDSINTIGTDLNIQPLRQGALSIMGGLVSIDTQGNLTVEGNATFAKDVSVKGKLSANIIAPVPDQDLIVKLGESNQESGIRNQEKSPNLPAGRQGSSFIIHDSSGKEVAKIDQTGSISSSGSAIFSNLKIVRGVQADTSRTETIASASAGTAVILKNETERTIVTPYVSENSLIYITQVGNSQGITPYIARQLPENPSNGTRGSFTIQLPHPLTTDVKLNWWIIN